MIEEGVREKMVLTPSSFVYLEELLPLCLRFWRILFRNLCSYNRVSGIK